MTYTPITDEQSIRKAFEIIKRAFQAGDIEEKEVCKHPAWLHKKINLYGAFGEVVEEKKYWIGFGYEEDEKPIFGANIAMEGTGRDGLFVRDEESGRTLFTHSGNLHLGSRKEEKYKRHPARRGCAKKLKEFTGPDMWVDVEEKSRLKVTLPFDDDPSSVDLDEIARVHERIRAFTDNPRDVLTQRPGSLWGARKIRRLL